MKPVVKSWLCWDVPNDDLENWVPDRDDWEIAIEIEVGEEGKPGADLFQFLVRSARSIQGEVASKGVAPVSRTFVFERFDFDVLRAEVERVIQSCNAKTWDRFCKQLNWYMQWEFENYEP